MSETTACPECQRKVRLPEGTLGRKVRCPSCGAAFVATAGARPAAPPPPPANPFAEEPAPVSSPPLPWERAGTAAPPPPPAEDFAPPTPEVAAGTSRDDWQSVRVGLQLQCWAHLCYLGALLLTILVLLIFLSQYEKPRTTITEFRNGRPVSQKTTEDSKFLIVLVDTMGMLVVLASMANRVGSVVAGCLCMVAPTRHGSRSLALAGLILVGVTLLAEMNILAMQSDRGARDSGPGGLATATSLSYTVLIEVGRLTVLGWMLRGLAMNLKLHGSASTGTALGLLTPVIILGTLALAIIIRYFFPPEGPTVPVLLAALVFAGQIVVLVFGIGLMLRIQSSIGKKMSTYARD
jgi:hypothetical protein